MTRRYEPILLQRIDEYLAWLRKRNRAEVTLTAYGYTLNQFYDFLNQTKGLTTVPSKIGDKEVRAYLEKRKKEIGKKYYQTQARQLKSFFDYIENDTINEMGLRFSRPPRPNVIWLDENETEKLIESIETPLEEMVIHLGLELGIRMIGIRRLRVQDFDNANKKISICGKGPEDGVWREVPYHPETERILKNWLKVRNKIIAKAKKKRTNPKIPDNLLIYHNPAWGAGAYTKNGMAGILRRVVKRAKINPKCAFHTLRRTLGKTMYNNGIEIEKIAQILGHTNTTTTLLYIGINIEEMSEALQNGAIFRRGRARPTFG